MINTRVPVNDDGSDECMKDMLLYLPQIVQVIETTLVNQGYKVVVHCQAGQQRSATVVAAYLMGWNADEAIAFVKVKKPDAFFWQVNFLSVLQEFDSSSC